MFFSSLNKSRPTTKLPKKKRHLLLKLLDTHPRFFVHVISSSLSNPAIQNNLNLTTEEATSPGSHIDMLGAKIPTEVGLMTPFCDFHSTLTLCEIHQTLLLCLDLLWTPLHVPQNLLLHTVSWSLSSSRM